MKILDILTAPWAIEPSKLLEIQSIYATHMRGEKIDIDAVEKRLGRQLNNDQKDYQVIDGVAILSLEGVIAKKANMFMQISGGVSTQIASRNLAQAQNDASVHSIIQYIDSPGGTVDGTQLYADDVIASRGNKPIVTLASGLMASAGYWIGSAASRIYISDATTQVGSIGVVTSHVDVSGAESQRGIKTTEIYSGQYKRIASQYAPLSDAGRKSMQDTTDYLYSLFVQAVAKNRGVSEEKVLADMADGRMFIGQQAVDAGLVDGVITLDALIAQLNQEQGSSGVSKRSTKLLNLTTPKGQTMTTLTAEQVAADNPEIAAAFRAEGATAERKRIQDIEAQSIPGHEALIATLKFDGKSSGGDAAMAVLAAERTTRNAAAAALAADSPAPVNQTPQSPAASAAADSDKELTRAELDAKAKEHMSANPGISYIDAYKAVGGR